MEGEHVPTTVCVTGASGYIGSWLVMKLLQRGYFVRATVRNPGDEKKVKHLLELPHADTHLSLWKANLVDEGSFDEAVRGCTGVFHVANPMEIHLADPENEMIKPTVNGLLNVMRACCKAKTVKRLVHTSTTGAVTNREHHPPVYDESCWTDIEWCKSQKMYGWAYMVGKTMAEKIGRKFAEENGVDLVTIIPPIVQGPFLTPSMNPSAEISIALIIRNKALYPWLTQMLAVHVDDLCNAHIFLLEHPEAKGRYLCVSHFFTIFQLTNSLAQKYPEYNIPTKFEGIDESSVKARPCSSKKLTDLGFEFKYRPDNYSPGDLFAEGIETCKAKGLLPLSL